MNIVQIVYLLISTSILLATGSAVADENSMNVDSGNDSSSAESNPIEFNKFPLRKQKMTGDTLDQPYYERFIDRLISIRNPINRHRRLESPNHSFIRFGRAAIPLTKELHKDVWQNMYDMRRMTKGGGRDTSFIRFGRSLNRQQNG